MNITKAYYINLDKSKERNTKFIEKELIKTNIKFERYVGIDGNIIKFDDIKDESLILDKSDKRIGGNIAIYLTHTSLWKKISEDTNDNNIYLICEDDAILPNDFDSKLDELCKYIPEDWNFFYLFYNKRVEGEKINNNIIKPHSHKIYCVNTGFVCYLIKPSACRILIKNMLPFDLTKNIGNYGTSIDFYIKNYYNLIQVFFHTPKMVEHRNDLPSDRKDANNNVASSS